MRNNLQYYGSLSALLPNIISTIYLLKKKYYLFQTDMIFCSAFNFKFFLLFHLNLKMIWIFRWIQSHNEILNQDRDITCYFQFQNYFHPKQFPQANFSQQKEKKEKYFILQCYIYIYIYHAFIENFILHANLRIRILAKCVDKHRVRGNITKREIQFQVSCGNSMEKLVVVVSMEKKTVVLESPKGRQDSNCSKNS